jgi:hypothetical protein
MKAEFAGGDALFWSGIGDKVIDSETYQGAGDIIAFAPQTETAELEANGIVLTINGIDSSLIATALTDAYQGRPITLKLGCLDETYAVIATYTLFKGLMDVMTISDDGNYSNISLTCENILIGMNRSKATRYTHNEQTSLYAGDEGFKFVEQLQDKTITWGR